MPGNSRGGLAEEALPQNLFATRTPLDPLSCHARRARGTASLPVPAARRRAPPPRHPGRLAADHGISRATAYRYTDEAVDVHSAQAQGLDRAGGTGPRPGHRRRPRARPPSPVPGRRLRNAHAGRRRLRRSRNRHPRPRQEPGGNQRLDPDTKTRNSLLRGLRSQRERGFALLTQRWTALQRITAAPQKNSASCLVRTRRLHISSLRGTGVLAALQSLFRRGRD
jgi:hypothetical protein